MNSKYLFFYSALGDWSFSYSIRRMWIIPLLQWYFWFTIIVCERLSTSHPLCGLLERCGTLSPFLYFLSFNLFVSSVTFLPPGFFVPFINLQGLGLYHNIPSDCYTRNRWPLLFISCPAALSYSLCIVSLPAVFFFLCSASETQEMV